MALKHISYQKTGYFSALMNDYLAEKETLHPFFNRFPRIENFEKQFYEKKDFFSKKKREVLVASLTKQYEGFVVSNLTQQMIIHLPSLQVINSICLRDLFISCIK